MTKKNKKQDKAFDGFDFEEFKAEALEKLKTGAKLSGENGIFGGLMQRFINAALEGEVEAQIKEDKSADIPNRRNGYTSKQIRSEYGPLQIDPPRDRAGNFEPMIIKKWDREINSGLDDQILLMYAHGNSYSDIQFQLKKIYGVDISSSVIAQVTEKVQSEILEWQQRSLEPVYTALFLDGIYFTSRESGKAQKKVMYTVYAVDCEGQRDVLGIYIKGNESAHEWTKVMEDLKKRGVEDIFFICIDGLRGLQEAIETEFPQAIVQRCIVHKVRNSIKYVAEKDKKEVCKDLKTIYNVADITQAEMALQSFKIKWDETYPEISKLWEKDWAEITNFFNYSGAIKRLIYTTNPVEALHRQIRKVTKTKGIWVNDKALITQIYLILNYQKGSWRKKVFNWVKIARELNEVFGERFSKNTN